MKEYIDKISKLNKEEFVELLTNYTENDRIYAEEKARALTEERFGKKIYIRGLIEFTNYCRNNCLYCGIRYGNKSLERFRLTIKEIMDCCARGYNLGFRTLVLQGGEDPYFTVDMLENIVSEIHGNYPDCAITLSLGELPYESYKRLYDAGANRYLLRHETADPEHYEKLHPGNMSFEKRMKCLKDLKAIGYQTGCGIMVGSPFQTPATIAEDLLFMRAFKPEMVGIGPFLPQSCTPFKDETAGSVELTLFLISLIRLILPDVLLPSTTALGSAAKDGRIRGIMAGANVYMPNLSLEEHREKYLLYDNKAGLADEAGYVIEQLRMKLGKHGYVIVTDRGDYYERNSIV